jgi:hypothetical protein
MSGLEPRKPDSQGYDLGHYEQMQFDMLISFGILSWKFFTEKNHDAYEKMYDELDTLAERVEKFHHVFERGTVTIIHNPEEEQG